MKKQKKTFKDFYQNSIFSKTEFYVKMSLILLLSVIFAVIFFVKDGYRYFQSFAYADKYKGYDFQVHVIDVGKGDAMLLKLPNNQTMMIDTGDERYSSDVTSYIQQYFWSENLKQIDYLVLTHPDADHVGGASAIIDKFKVVNLYRPKLYSHYESENCEINSNYQIDESEIYSKAIKKAYQNECNIIFNQSEITFEVGGCKIEFLAPSNYDYTNSNNHSVVIMITYQNKKFLFMGDAESLVENSLVSQYGDYLQADVLKVGHHGSKTSTSAEFLYYVKPKYAILSCNASEYYPHAEVVERLNDYNTTMLSTGIRGSFVVAVVNQEIVYANAKNNTNTMAIIFTIYIILIAIIWSNPVKKINQWINSVKDD